MPSYRDIQVIVDGRQWRGDPAAFTVIKPLAGQLSIDVGAMLLTVGTLSMPSATPQYALASLWAWIRYFAAVANVRGLRLKNDWTDIDTHQKMILSDDWGVGLSAEVVGRAFGVARWTHTQGLARQFPATYQLQSKAKKGVSKSPDLIGLVPGKGVVVLECKGTQGSRSQLADAMDKGCQQKRALRVVGRTVVANVVSGVCITREAQQHPTSVILADPPASPENPRKGDSALEAEILRQHVVDALNFMGLYQSARAIEGSDWLMSEAARASVWRSLDEERPSKTENGSVIRTSAWSYGTVSEEGSDSHPMAVQIRARLGLGVFEELARKRDWMEVFANLAPPAAPALDSPLKPIEGTLLVPLAPQDEPVPWEGRSEIETQAGLEVEATWSPRPVATSGR